MNATFNPVCIAAILLTGFLPALANAEKPIHPAVEQLDLDGDMVLFLHTDTLEERVLEYIDTNFLEGPLLDVIDPRILAGIATQTKAVIEWSGLLSLEAYAMSTKSVEDGLNRIIVVSQHATSEANKPLWRLLGSEPRELKGIKFVPTNAVYTANATTSLNEVWKIANEAVAHFGGPEGVAQFNQQIMMAQMLLGTPFNALTESIENDLLLSIQFSDDQTVTLGAGPTFPEPSLLLGFEINDPVLGTLLLQKLQQAGMPATKSMHHTHELHTVRLPIPSPIPLSPTLVMTDDYLLMGSTIDVVKEALDCAEKESGLISTPLYQRLLKEVPEKTSAIEFLSPRLVQTYRDVLTFAIHAQQQPEMEFMMEMMTQTWTNLYMGGYTLKTPTGYSSEFYANYDGSKSVEWMASSYLNLLTAVMIPIIQQELKLELGEIPQNDLPIH
ncbi:MAG: DUF3352 domain-containing protein [Pontiella sp.]